MVHKCAQRLIRCEQIAEKLARGTPLTDTDLICIYKFVISSSDANSPF